MKIDSEIKETKKEKFDRILPTRLDNFLLASSRLKNMANRFTFEWSEDDAKRILSVVEKELQDIKASFKRSK